MRLGLPLQVDALLWTASGFNADRPLLQLVQDQVGTAQVQRDLLPMASLRSRSPSLPNREPICFSQNTSLMKAFGTMPLNKNVIVPVKDSPYLAAMEASLKSSTVPDLSLGVGLRQRTDSLACPTSWWCYLNCRWPWLGGWRPGWAASKRATARCLN